jgi:hypothetical protein
VQGSYTSRSGTGTITLSGVVINTGGGVTGSTVVSASATCFLAMLASKANTLTTAEADGAYPLQYDANAYKNLPGGGSSTLAGCSGTSGTATINVASPNTTQTMLVCQKMYVTDKPLNPGSGVIPANTQVLTAPTAGTSFTITANLTGTLAANTTLTFYLGTSSDYANALLEDANANLNAGLDQLTPVFQALEALGIGCVFRPMGEANAGASIWYHWSSPGNCTWFSYLFAYCWGYLTGNQVFSGQPVSPNPVHNLAFVHAPLADTAANTIIYPPIINGKWYADIVGVDNYANPPNGFATAMNAMNGIAGGGGLPAGFAEAHGNTTANSYSFGFLDPTTYAGGGVDLHSLSGGDLVLVQAPDMPNAQQPPYNNFASSGSVTVPTSNGLFTVSYASLTGGPASPVTLHNLTVTGVTSGSLLPPKGCVVQPNASPGTNCGTPTFTTNVFQGRAAWVMTWWGVYGQMYQDPSSSGSTAYLTDSRAINLENLSTYFTVPWGFGSATDNIALTDAATRSIAVTTSGSDNIGFGDTATRGFHPARTGSDNIALSDAATRFFSFHATATDNIAFGDATTRAFHDLATASDSIAFTDSAVRGGAGHASASDQIAFHDAAGGVVPNLSSYLSFQAILNKLAGTTGLEAQGAANVWAGTKGLELLGALNHRNESVGLGLNLVVAEITNNHGYDATLALNLYSGWVPRGV